MHPDTTAVTEPPAAGVVAPAGLIDPDDHVRWDAIESEVRAERGQSPRQTQRPAIGTDYTAIYQQPFAPPPSHARRVGGSYFAGFRPANALSGVAQIGLAVTSLATVVVLWSLWTERGVLSRISDGEIALGGEIASSDERLAQWFVIRLLLYALTGVAFLAWFSRAYKNTAAVNPWEPVRHSSGWAVGAWFVPFLNWVRPVSMANEMWRKSESPQATSPTPATVLWIWWPAFLVGSLGTQMSPRLEDSLEAGVDVDLLLLLNTVWMFGLVASLVAGFAAMAFVGTLTERLNRRFVELRTWEQTTN